MMKKLSIFLVLILTFSLLMGCAAGNKPEDNGAANDGDSTDATTSASVVTDTESFKKAAGEDGTWIIIFEEDVTVDEEIVLEGEFHDKDNEENDLYRKIAPYAQDADHNITERYTVTAPKLTVKSPNTRLQGGTFAGDIYVEAEGFNLSDATVDGNVYFATEELKSAFELDEKSTVTGSIEVMQ
jgi:hypothetical protein